jgi:hypothetical protein
MLCAISKKGLIGQIFVEGTIAYQQHLLQLQNKVIPMKPSQAISHIRDLISDDGDQDGPQNIGLIQTFDMADSLRRLH